MAKKYISLREVARRLNIPPSTVVYYKDRFAGFIPSEGGEGRNRRYPVDVLDVFKRIREMFNNNWTVEQIEEELSGMRNAAGHVDAQAAQASGRSADDGRDVSKLLLSVSDLLENQTLIGGEIRSLKDELEALRLERMEAEARHLEQVRMLEVEIAALREKAGPMGSKPSWEYMSRPLVVRNAKGEYLGVLGKENRHFSLKEFTELLRRNVAGGDEGVSWDNDGDLWTLTATARECSDMERHLVMVTKKTITPSKNVVTEVVRLNMGGEDVPQAMLLGLFKQLRDEFSGRT